MVDQNQSMKKDHYYYYCSADESAPLNQFERNVANYDTRPLLSADMRHDAFSAPPQRSNLPIVYQRLGYEVQYPHFTAKVNRSDSRAEDSQLLPHSPTSLSGTTNGAGKGHINGTTSLAPEEIIRLKVGDVLYIAYMGFITLVNFNGFISNQEIFAGLFDELTYTLIIFFISIPNLLIGLFGAKIIKYLGEKKLIYLHFIIQMIAAVIQIIMLKFIGTGLSIKDKSYIAMIVLVFITILCCSSIYAIVQTIFFSLAVKYKSYMVMVYITGLSTSNLVLGGFLFLINTHLGSTILKGYLRFGFIFLTLTIGLIWHYIKNPTFEKEEVEKHGGTPEEEDLIIPEAQVEPMEEAIGTPEPEVKECNVPFGGKEKKKGTLISIFLERKFYLLLTFGMFFSTFFVYPTFMFLAKSSDPKLHSWPIILMLLFALFDFIARLIKTIQESINQKKVMKKEKEKRETPQKNKTHEETSKGINEEEKPVEKKPDKKKRMKKKPDEKKNKKRLSPSEALHLGLCCFHFGICLIPFLTFLVAKNLIDMPALVCDILNGIFYPLIAFSFGYTQNILAKEVSSKLEDKDRNILGSEFNFMIVFGIVLGCLFSFLFNLIPVSE